ncbi:MAG: hypothetical protein JJ975_15655 [Bacteroidia bacterium]|nr:hypothetical protein [Bacteroidia bacterium]
MTINTTELFKVIELLKIKIRENFGDEINIESEDLYWEIAESELFNPYNEPCKLSLGSISDDWEQLSRLLNPEDTPLSYDLIRLSIVLMVIRKHSAGSW